MENPKYTLKGLTKKEKEDKLLKLTNEEWLKSPESEKLLFMQLTQLTNSNGNLITIKRLIIGIILIFLYFIMF